MVPGRTFEEVGVIRSIRSNHKGTKLSLICDTVDKGGERHPDTALYVYDVELDKLEPRDFGPTYYPVEHAWDMAEPRLLAVEAHRIKLERTGSGNKRSSGKHGSMLEESDNEYKGDDSGELRSSLPEVEVTMLFATSDYGVLMQDSFAITKGNDSLMGVEVPYVYVMSQATEGQGPKSVPHMRQVIRYDTINNLPNSPNNPSNLHTLIIPRYPKNFKNAKNPNEPNNPNKLSNPRETTKRKKRIPFLPR